MQPGYQWWWQPIVWAFALGCMAWMPTALASGAYSELYTLGNDDGDQPTRMVEGPDGNLYGTVGGGSAGSGMVFRITPAGAFAIVHVFTGPEGAAPVGLTAGPDGNLWGTTASGGAYDGGVVFRISPAGELTTIVSFPPARFGGSAGLGRLTVAGDGNLYAWAAYLGDHDCGALVQITPGGKITLLHSFEFGPRAGADGPTLGSDGKLYGIADGAFVRISTGGAVSVIHTFGDGEGNDGSIAVLAQADGSFLGAAPGGGANGTGNVFRITPSGAYEVVASFPPNRDGTNVWRARLIDGGDGNFYGVTSHGGPSPCQCGYVFKLAADHSLTLDYYFESSNDTYYRDVMRGSDGFFYGVDDRTVFRFSAGYPPAPMLSMSADPIRVVQGSDVTIRWTSSDVDTCDSGGDWSGARAKNGRKTVTPSRTFINEYSITCHGINGTVLALVQVRAYPPAAVSIHADPDTLPAQHSTTLTWSSSLGVDGCQASGAWSGAKGGGGTQNVTPAQPGTPVYALHCTGGGGSADASVTLNVQPPLPPAISIGFQPASMVVGHITTLSWSTTDASSCTGSNSWSGTISTSGTRTAKFSDPGSYVYTLTCSGPGGTTTAGATLTVNQEPVGPKAAISPGDSYIVTGTHVGSSSTPVPFQLKNVGDSTLHISNIQLQTSGDFSQVHDCPAALEPGQHCTISITFKPASINLSYARIDLATDAVSGPASITLNGIGLGAIVTLDPEGIGYLDKMVGSSSATRGAKLTNTGNAPLNIQSLTTSGDFTSSSGCAAVLNPGKSCSIHAVFTPTQSGTRTGWVDIASDAISGPARLRLSGEGLALPTASLAPNPLQFGGRTVGDPPVAKAIALHNTGGVALSVSAISIDGDFRQSNDCGTRLGPGKTCHIKVLFAPTAAGLRQGTLRVETGAASSPDTVPLSGTGR